MVVSNLLDRIKGVGTLQPNVNLGTPSAPSPLPAAPAPIQIPQIGGFPSGGGATSAQSQTSGSFTPQQADLSVDPILQQALQQRVQGQTGGPSFEQVLQGQFQPASQLLDLQFNRAKENLLSDLASRGVLKSGETIQSLGDLETQLAATKGSLIGDLAANFEQQRQNAINQAISAFGILEGNKISAKATITSANIGAAAQVKSAAISAGATVQSAQISAQARLQEAGMNVRIALQSLQQERELSFIDQGIDPVLFATDPVYRGDWFALQEQRAIEENELLRLENQERRNALLGV